MSSCLTALSRPNIARQSSVNVKISNIADTAWRIQVEGEHRRADCTIIKEIKPLLRCLVFRLLRYKQCCLQQSWDADENVPEECLILLHTMI